MSKLRRQNHRTCAWKRERNAFSVSVPQEEEEGSDEESLTSSVVSDVLVPPSCRATWPAANEEDSDRDSDPAFVSPIDEVKAVRQHGALTTANLHEASRWAFTESHLQQRLHSSCLTLQQSWMSFNPSVLPPPG